MSDGIGNMWERVEFVKNTPTPVGAGGSRDNYSLVVATRGELRRKSWNRTIDFADIQGYNNFSLKVRKRASIMTVLDMSLKAKIGGIFYSIHGWDDTDRLYLYFDVSIKR